MTARWIAHHAEVLGALATMPDCSADGALSDVPYGLGSRQPVLADLIAYLSGSELDTKGDFMGAGWSVPSVRVWRELHRVLKPGAHVLSFAGSRTGDLISLGMRAAGFEIRDTLQWIYASAMPHSSNVSKAIDKKDGAEREVIGIDENLLRRKPNGMNTPGATAYGWASTSSPTDARITAPATEDAKHWDGFGSNLKPCFEPIILARKPLDGTLVENVREWGVGALAIDACRLEYVDEADKAAAAAAQRACLDQNANRTAYGRYENGPESIPGFLAKQDLGRWPPNVLLDEAAAALLDAQSGDRPSGIAVMRNGGGGRIFNGTNTQGPRPDAGYSDSGGASRFLFVAKASRWERELGCEGLPIRSAGETVGRKEGSAGIQNGRAGAGRTANVRNYGPCVKPIALDRWLASLILPPPRRDGTPRRLIVPYAGTGSEMMGALLAGWDLVEGIEREPRPNVADAPDFISILRARVAFAEANPRAFDPDAKRTPKADDRQPSLFGERP